MLLWYVAFIQNAEVGGVGARDEAGGLRGEGGGRRKPRRCGADAGVSVGCPGPSSDRSVMEGGSVGKPEAGERGGDGEDFCVERLAFVSLACGVGFDDAEVFPALGDDVALGDFLFFEEEAEALEFARGGFGVVIFHLEGDDAVSGLGDEVDFKVTVFFILPV